MRHSEELSLQKRRNKIKICTEKKMAFAGLSLFLLLLLCAVSRGQETEGECRYRYVEQPPSSLSCQPGQQLLLECTVQVPPLSSQLSVAWFRGSTSDACSQSVERLQGAGGVVVREQRLQDADMLTLRSQLMLSQSEVSAGSYWCQLQSSEGGRGFPRSRVLVVLPAPAYQLLPPCTAVQSVLEEMCADRTQPSTANCTTDAPPVSMTTAPLTPLPTSTSTANDDPAVTMETTSLVLTTTEETTTSDLPATTEDAATVELASTAATTVELTGATTEEEEEEAEDDESVSVHLVAAITAVVLLAVLVGVLSLVCVRISLRAGIETRKLKRQQCRMQGESTRTLSTLCSRSSVVASDYLVPRPFLPPSSTFPRPSLRQSFALQSSLRMSHDYEDIPDLVEQGHYFGAISSKAVRPGALTMTRNAAYRAYFVDSSREALREASLDSLDPITAAVYINLSPNPPPQ